jgi:hypothetical protein
MSKDNNIFVTMNGALMSAILNETSDAISNNQYGVLYGNTRVRRHLLTTDSLENTFVTETKLSKFLIDM